ncbi:MAG: hypothetical protein Q9217_005536, partial [Psora testacea]
MSVSEDLINFDIIETHKENIQSLPGGRSAKALASHFAPTSRSSIPTPGDTRNLNDAIRQEYELELNAIQDSDDPLDIYDRYVKWTLGAYPSAQATPESQLRPLLERATKASQSAPHYKNDPRHLKLWLNYIRFFSDAPRETFAYLARHHIGEGLALYYEEFAAWFESAGRWKQADEVYKLGMEREARPAERLIRKFGEFQRRFESRTINGEEPSSPALPTVRPALAAKVDPFAISTPGPANPQAPRQSLGIGGSTNRGGRQKLTIFSDSDVRASSGKSILEDGAKGWDNIGTIADRKKENTIEPRPWTGETLKTGKRGNGTPKMMIFKDESSSQIPVPNTMPLPRYADQQPMMNSRTGKLERVFVNLEAVYPSNDNLHEEISFEELRAKARGWLARDWAAESKQQLNRESQHTSAPKPEPLITLEEENVAKDSQATESQQDFQSSPNTQLETTIAVDINKEGKIGRPKKLRIKEIKGETQTIKTNLESPTGPKLRRKNSAEPTMTLHTKAATDDILDIFNQPLRNVDPIAGPPESDGETDYDDDEYTSAGESTGTGRISGTSEFGDTEPNVKSTTTNADTAAESVSPWSDFSAGKHVPKPDADDAEAEDPIISADSQAFTVHEDSVPMEDPKADNVEVTTPVLLEQENEAPRTRYVPIPPEDYAQPERYPRDPEAIAQTRLPFMTPIIEKTETSLGALSIHAEKDYFNSKTPSRHDSGPCATPVFDGEPLSNPFREIVNETRSPMLPKLKIAKSKAARDSPEVTEGPIIKDAYCNPVDDSIRNIIMDNAQPPLSSYQGYHDHRPENFSKAPEIRKFIRTFSKAKMSDKTTTSLPWPPLLQFPSTSSKTFTIRRELGQGAFAPVYLAEEKSTDPDDESNCLVAIKCEHPPTPWEFHIMTLLHMRLPPSHRSSASFLRPRSFHLFNDEAYLLEEYLDQGTLLDLVNTAKSNPISGQTTLDESIAMFFTIELLRTVEAMHSMGILHGDLKADNCLVRLLPTARPPPSPPPSSPTKDDDYWEPQYQPDGSAGWSARGLTLIDFGRSIDMRAFSPSTQFIADWKTGKQDCVEMRELRPWTYQVDYYGLAGVVHSLLFGKYLDDCVVLDDHNNTTNNNNSNRKDGMEAAMALSATGGGGGPGGIIVGAKKKYKIREGLKRYWQTQLWGSLFDLLLNPSSHLQAEQGGCLPITMGLRA